MSTAKTPRGRGSLQPLAGTPAADSGADAAKATAAALKTGVGSSSDVVGGPLADLESSLKSHVDARCDAMAAQITSQLQAHVDRQCAALGAQVAAQSAQMESILATLRALQAAVDKLS